MNGQVGQHLMFKSRGNFNLAEDRIFKKDSNIFDRHIFFQISRQYKAAAKRKKILFTFRQRTFTLGSSNFGGISGAVSNTYEGAGGATPAE